MVLVYTLQAFTNHPQWGNSAWVVLEADNLSERDMQSIAKKIWLSETAFVLKSDKADFKVRFFTPNSEVNLCWHATIATFFLMKRLNVIASGSYTEETKSGIMNINVWETDTVWMTQNLPEFFDKIDKEEIAESLGIHAEDVADDLPIQIVSTWLKDILVPVKNMEVLDNFLKPNFTMIAEISKKYNVTWYHVFALTDKKNEIACRNFAPLYDIPEESATGTSSAALACYLHHYRSISGTIVFKQWYAMQKPSTIIAEISVGNNAITKVQIGGVCADIQSQEIVL